MKYGYFDDFQKEYVITTPKTPLPWINYLGCEDFFSLKSNTGGGYCFFRDARLLRLTRYRYNNVPLDSNGHYFYIHDQDTVWNPGWQPTQTSLDSYECRHGLGYSRWNSTKNQLQAEMLTFVPLGFPCEVTQLRLTNHSDCEKKISLFSYVEFCLWDALDDMTNFQRNFSTGEVELSGSSIIHKTEYRERRNHYAFFSVNAPLAGFDTDREAFLGAYQGPSHPQAVFENASRNSLASGWSPIGSHHLTCQLAPGESHTWIFVLGYAELSADQKWTQEGKLNQEPMHRFLQAFSTEEQVQHAWIALQEHWTTLLSGYSVHTEDDRLNRMVNIWNQYQCITTFNLSRSASYYESGIGRGMGFRDSCQDLLGFVHLIPDKARQRILDIAATQFPDGSAYHQYQPLTKKGNDAIGSGFCDDPLWLIAATAAYLKETDDWSILSEQVPFDNDESIAEPLKEHLRRSFQFTLTHRGSHGLPLIGRADWNDCLNLNCFSETPGESFQTTGPSEGNTAESVFIAGMFVLYGNEYAAICRKLHLEEEAAAAEAAVSDMYQAILTHGWDGSWFLRAYDASGKRVGSSQCQEGQIFIEPQGFCVMAGVGVPEGLAQKALQSVEERLDTRYGIVLLQPPYQSYHKELGEISSYPPGYKENAGIFCHNNPWISIAEAKLGHGDRAFATYQRICPAYLEEISDIHRTEPYVYSQMIAGIDAPHFGEAKNSWLTGTAAWTFVSVSQYLLGIRADYNGLIVDPCIPSSCTGFQVTRKFRQVTYQIEVQNPHGLQTGVHRLLIDGQLLEGCQIPYDPSKKLSHITAILEEV